MIKEIMFSYHQYMISRQNILMKFRMISYLTEEPGLRKEGMLNTLEWDSSEKILLKLYV